ncbi:Rrf2 family transcriptional regulator [Corallococcus llansteffanensis]|uniref:Rrf2 family transcriptional regulator n=1 Tax=Corallococcus llansteffanensis TaxID=2316731 RepID=A0A3A8NR35_9BACT|nr:Rrf2 family transcriptional regulator [Corallococcus llansteffanensis]RKH42452.1 Rrf2 family transcriptional regulator [Corallococcus llansteffanensis]
MRRDSRLSVALHVLLHMKELGPVVTSEAIGQLMKANPVVVRRTMAGLREAGIVGSVKGHGGGWSLARPLEAVTLGDVYDALGTPALFSIGPREESPGCLVEQAVNRALGKALDEAEARLMSQLRSVTVADLSNDVLRSHALAQEGETPPTRAKPRRKRTS